MSPHNVDRAGWAWPVVAAVLLVLVIVGASVAGTVGAAAAGDASELEGDSTTSLEDDGHAIDADFEGSTDDTHDVEASADVEVDAETPTNETAVESTANASADELDATASVEDNDTAVGTDVEASVDDAIDVAASVDAESSDDTSSDESNDSDAGEETGDAEDVTDESDDERATDEDVDDSEGGLPAPDRRTGGLAVGSLLVGAGLLARKTGTLALSTGASGSASTLSVALEWLRSWGWRLLGLAGYKRFDDTDPLEHETRATIYEHLRDAPGAYLSEIADETNVPLSTLRYHLRILAFENLVTDVTVRGKRRFVPIDADHDALTAALDDEATAAVLEALAEEPDSVSGLADRLERDPSTVTHHLQRLEDEGLVERERQGRSVINRLAGGLDVAVANDGRASSAAD